jgi:paraquat-inducible protein B
VPALIERVSELPLDDFVASATRTVDGIEALVRSDTTTALPGSVDAALVEARGLITDLRDGGAIETASASLASLRQLTDELRAANLGAEIAKALAAAEGAIANIDVASQRAPALIDSLQALTERVDQLPLDTFLASATRTVDGVDALVRSDSVTALPGSVDAALDEARGLIAELRAGGSVENLGATLASLRQLADELRAADLGTQVSNTVANVDAATSGLPELIDNLRALSATVDQLPLDELVGSATRVLDSADTFLASNGLDQVPDELARSLAQVRLLIAELREGGAVENVNATLASADQAAAAITAAAARLPALIAQLEGVSQRADTALATFSPGSELTRETQMLIRDLRTTSQSVNALVNALERRPNSVLFGR